MNNPLLDQEFLVELMEHRQREIFARITLLTNNELPIEYIEGRVTAGTINVDGASALRRTCNLTMILKDQSEINEFNWTFKSKFKLEVGLKNMINTKYPEIIWFPQGIFILTTCNMNQATNNYTITISGKDKMCLLNGDLSGNIPHSTDFGVEEYYDTVTGEITYNKLLLKDIIRNILQTFGGELPENIIINDLDEAGLELMEYRHETLPLYLYRDIESGEVVNVTLNGDDDVQVVNTKEIKKLNEFTDSDFIYTSTLSEENESKGLIVYQYDTDAGAYTDTKYQIIRYKYGDLAGYRLTDLTYAGELKCNIGETIVSVLDKIVKMLSDFEYFYNLDGKFIFQKKHTYISTPWGGVEQDKNNGIIEALNNAHSKINLMDAQLTTAFANNPNLLNIKNDFSVWGTYKSISGADIPIHMRYALDTKPTKYKTIRSLWTRREDAENPIEPDGYIDYKDYCEDKTFEDENGIPMIGSYLTKAFSTISDDDSIIVDWREIIYQMALDYYSLGTKDDFCLQVAAENPQYPTGKTGYEHYYVDLQGFWRQLYDPKPEATYVEINAKDVATNGEINEDIYLDGYYQPLKKENLTTKDNKRAYDLNDLYIIQDIEVKNSKGEAVTKIAFYPFIGSKKCCLSMVSNDESNSYWYYDSRTTKYEECKDVSKLNLKALNSLYEVSTEDDTKKVLVVDSRYDAFLNNYNDDDPQSQFWIKTTGKISLNKLQNENSILDTIYRDGISNNKDYVQFLSRWGIKDNYGNLATPNENDEDSDDIPQEITDRVTYVEKLKNGDYLENHWNVAVAENPDQLIFWFDFLETEGSDLYKYSIRQIGPRTKSVNDSNVKSIYYRDVPNVIFMEDLADELYDKKPGYTYIQLPLGFESLFSISGRGKSAKEAIDELLQAHSYAIEQTNIITVPLYHLEPNTRVAVKDKMSNVDGEYIVTKITIPMTHTGTMSLSANKVVSNIM